MERLRTRASALLLGAMIALGCGCASDSVLAAEDSESLPDHGPQLWLHGMVGRPDISARLGSRGVRTIVDLRSTQGLEGPELLEHYAQLNQGIVISVRWPAPANPKWFEKPPTTEEAARATRLLVDLLKSEPAREMGERGDLWLQFYNEAFGGIGKLPPNPDDAKKLQEFATNIVKRLRVEAPYVKISSPGYTGVGVLNETNAALLSGKNRLRYEAMMDWLEWSVRYADGVDVHLHSTSGQEAAEKLAAVRNALNRVGGEKVPLVSWEWSAAHYPNPNDLMGAREATLNIYREMARYGVTHAAYSQYWSGEIAPNYQWVTLTDENLEPREPFYSLFTGLATGQLNPLQDGGDAIAGGDESDGESTTQDQPRDRRRRTRSRVVAPGDDQPGRIRRRDDDQVNAGLIDPTNPGLTEPWVHGVVGSPEGAHQLGAGGVRTIIDLNDISGATARSYLRQYERLGMGLAISVRWEDPDDRKVDAPPSAKAGDEAIESLVEMLKSDEAQALNGRLWLQFYNEFAGGPGKFRPQDVDAMFDWAERAARRVREEAPHVLICGPALTGVDVLEKPEDQLSRLGRARRDGLLRALRFAVEYADAIDLHLHVGSGDEARRELGIVRKALNRIPGGQDTGIVSWEWSCARYPDQKNREGVRQCILDVWNAMQEYGVSHAAYSAYWPNKKLKDIHQWKSLVTADGKPNEPFHSTFREIAQARSKRQSDRPLGDESQPGDAPENAPADDESGATLDDAPSSDGG